MDLAAALARIDELEQQLQHLTAHGKRRQTQQPAWMPTDPTELQDADRRETFLAHLTLAVASGEIRTKEANALRALCKELRDNLDVRSITREVQLCRDLFKEVLRRKGRLTHDEIEDIYSRVYRAVHDTDDDDDGE